MRGIMVQIQSGQFPHGGGRNALPAVVEPVQRRGARHIAFRVAVRGQQPQNFSLNLR
jgi:hypothetical protein